MSGEKITTAQLVKEAAALLAEEVKACLEWRVVIARASGTLEAERTRLQPFFATIERVMAADYADWMQSCHQVKDSCRRLEALLQHVEGIRGRAENLSALRMAQQEAAQQRSEAERIAIELVQSAEALRQRSGSICQRMDSAIAESLALRAAVADLRAHVLALYDDGRGPLRWVVQKEEELVRDLDRSSEPTEDFVADARLRMEQMFAEAKEKEREHQELLEIVIRLKTAFSNMQFELVSDSTSGSASLVPIRLVHEKTSAALAQTAESTIDQLKKLHIVTTARHAGHTSEKVMDGECGTHIDELVGKSSEVGLEFGPVDRIPPEGGAPTFFHPGSTPRKGWGHWRSTTDANHEHAGSKRRQS
jgi:hypothetical protein